MGKKNPFCAWKFILIYFVYFHNVSSSSDVDEGGKKGDRLIDKIKFCNTVYVIGNSSYVKSCGMFHYPKVLYTEDPNLALCMLVYDTTSKICEYSSKLPLKNLASALLPLSVEELDSKIEKFEYFNNNTDTCKKISLIFNKLTHSNIEGFKDLSPYLVYSQKKLLTKEECLVTCNSPVSNKINHLCTYLLWASEFFTSLKPITTENNEGSLSRKESQPNAKAITPKEIHENDDKKQSEIVKNDEKVDKSSKTVIESENQQDKKKQPSSTIKKYDDIPKHHIAAVDTANNEPKEKPNEDTKEEKQLEELNSHGSLPAPPKEEDVADVMESKKNDGDVDNVHQLLPDEVNQDADSLSAEDHQNKKGIDPEERIDRENLDIDQKESNNQGAEIPVKNPDDNDEFEQIQKFMPHPDSKAEEESHFFTYFSVLSLLCIVFYFGYHNKQKIFAILLEGRRSKRGRGSRRRPSTASYRKLDCNLEEAVTSQCNSNVTHVIY